MGRFRPWLLIAGMLTGVSAAAESTAIVSINAQGQAANAISDYPAISADGNYIAFQSAASDLVSGDTNARTDIFLYDRRNSITTRVSIGVGGAETNGDSKAPAISQDGRYIAFESQATNLVTNDIGGWQDIFVYDRVTATTVRVSVSSSGVEANNHCLHAALSGDGRFVAFISAASTLTSDDANSLSDVFLHDRDPDQNGVFDENYGSTVRVSQSGTGMLANSSNFPSISRNGQYVAYSSSDATLVAGDTNNLQDIFIYHRPSGVTERVSVASNGQQSDGESTFTSVSEEGRYVAFISSATNLVSGDTNSKADVFVRDRMAGTTVRASMSNSGTQSGGASTNPVISGDGRYVSFATESAALTSRLAGEAALVPVIFDAITAATGGGGGGGTAIAQVMYRRDLNLQKTVRISSNSSGANANGSNASLSMSAEGMIAAFASEATNLSSVTDVNATRDVFVRDMNASPAAVATKGGGGVVLLRSTLTLLLLYLLFRQRSLRKIRR
ncbi:MAG: PD40 domain-containing protein [Gammaproteobacteria bacterium]|nr:PD40 domain-containing protein [Gammaproteobacteria bacterium]